MERRNERRLRGLGQDSDTAKTKAKLSGELLSTSLYDRRTYFERAVGERA